MRTRAGAGGGGARRGRVDLISQDDTRTLGQRAHLPIRTTGWPGRHCGAHQASPLGAVCVCGNVVIGVCVRASTRPRAATTSPKG